VLVASALLRLYLADGPLPERLEEAADLLAELQRLPLRTMASMELCPHSAPAQPSAADQRV
jgi:hypothetical protein